MNIKYINLSVSEDEYNKNISPLIKEVLLREILLVVKL